jgi:hypothetical protein
VIAANPSPAAHIALFGAVIGVALVVYAVVRMCGRREAATDQRVSCAERSGSVGPGSPNIDSVVRATWIYHDLNG